MIRNCSLFIVRCAVLPALLALSCPALALANSEAPVITSAISNAPGIITIAWSHSGYGVFSFVLEQKAPFQNWVIASDKNFFSVLGLEANTLYEYRVCAVFDYNRVCSNEGSGYVAVTTMPPERRPPATPPPSPSAPHPQALHSPVLRALAIRRPDGGAVWVELRWINPWSDRQRSDADSPSLMRNNELIFSGELRAMLDTAPVDNATYALCLKNSVNAVCSAPVRAGLRGVEASFLTLDKRYMMHSNWLGYVDAVNNPEAAAHASFILRPGLDNRQDSVSFESTAVPGAFYVHERGRIKVQQKVDLPRFSNAASFIVRPPLGAAPLSEYLSFEATGAPGRFLYHFRNELWVGRDDGTPEFRASATFAQADALVPAATAQLLPPSRRLGKRASRRLGKRASRGSGIARPICELARTAPGRVPYNTVAVLLHKCIASKAGHKSCKNAWEAINRGMTDNTFQVFMHRCLAAPDKPVP